MVLISHSPGLYLLFLRVTETPSPFIPVNIESTLSRGLPQSCLPLFLCHDVVHEILRKHRPIIGICELAAKAFYSIFK